MGFFIPTFTCSRSYHTKTKGGFMKKITLLLLMVCLAGYYSLWAQTANTNMNHANGSHVMVNNMDIKWGDGPPSLPKGVQVAVLEGDPTKEGMFTLRATMPANYKVPPHWHPTTEHVTVIEGSLYMGMGEKIDEQNATELKTGGFSVMPLKTTHYAFTKAKCVIQVHAMGPFDVTYINPADDPRKK